MNYVKEREQIMTNYRLDIAYDGSRYRGWQKQGNTPDTIQAKLETLLSRLLAQKIEVAGSGRTDAGVHARRQTVSFRADTAMTEDELLRAIREHLPEDIGALSLSKAPERFHARLSAVKKTYLYRVWNSDAPCVFERKYVYPFPAPLDVSAMQNAAVLLLGKHDFAAFSTRTKGGKSTVRTIERIDISREGEELRFFFTGDGFLYNMVRILTGTLLEIGSGKRGADDIGHIFASGERAEAGFTVPGRGLCLWEVEYPDGF